VKWEYTVLAFRTKISVPRFGEANKPVVQNVQDELNDMGKKGWELVSVQNVRLETGSLFTVAYFKRKRP
jgi:hypothetical protein